MKRKITLKKSNDKIVNGQLSIPANLLKSMGVTELDRDVIINLEGKKLIIEKTEEKKNDILEITEEERNYLLQ